jgi:hypothetical protein
MPDLVQRLLNQNHRRNLVFFVFKRDEVLMSRHSSFG